MIALQERATRGIKLKIAEMQFMIEPDFQLLPFRFNADILDLPHIVSSFFKLTHPFFLDVFSIFAGRRWKGLDPWKKSRIRPLLKGWIRFQSFSTRFLNPAFNPRRDIYSLLPNDKCPLPSDLTNCTTPFPSTPQLPYAITRQIFALPNLLINGIRISSITHSLTHTQTHTQSKNNLNLGCKCRFKKRSKKTVGSQST